MRAPGRCSFKYPGRQPPDPDPAQLLQERLQEVLDGFVLEQGGIPELRRPGAAGGIADSEDDIVDDRAIGIGIHRRIAVEREGDVDLILAQAVDARAPTEFLTQVKRTALPCRRWA